MNDLEKELSRLKMNVNNKPIEPVVVEFVSPNFWPQDEEGKTHKDGKLYFLGTLEDILGYTKNGTIFGFAKLSSYRVVPAEEAKALRLCYYELCYEQFKQGETNDPWRAFYLEAKP